VSADQADLIFYPPTGTFASVVTMQQVLGKTKKEEETSKPETKGHSKAE
jgi:hypothetical protein